MHVTVRSYLTAGVAVVGAGAIALTPVQPMPGHDVAAANKAVSTIAVNLASTIDPITPWVDTFKAAAENIKIMHFDYWANGTVAQPGPFPIMSSIFFNQLTYAKWLFNGKAAQIPGQIAENFQTFFKVQREVNLKTLDPLHNLAWTVLPQLVDIPPSLQPLLDLTTTYSSGQFFGIFSPAIASLVQLTKSFTAVGEFFKNGDVIGAINELINIPANTTNAFLNGGQVLDLTGVVKNLLPPALTKFGIALGGLLTPGGSMFNALDLVANIGVDIPIPGVPAGVLTSSIDLGKQIGAAIYVDPNKTVKSAAAAPAAATAKPAAAAAVAAPELPAPVVDNTPAAPAVDNTPAVDNSPAVDNTPAPVVADIPEVEAPAPKAVSAPAVDTPAPAHRGGGDNSGSDNGGHSGARGHRGAA